jgi:glucokinase
MTTYIAVDMGGTNIRAARFAPNGQLLQRARHPTPKDAGGEVVLEQIAGAIREVLPTDDGVKAIGISAPGPLDPFSGVLYRAANVPSWVNFPLKDKVESIFELPVAVGNDANLAAMGEWKFGAGRGHNDLLFLTISTGIGGGAIVGGRLLVGARGLAAELGHTTITPDGPVCGCGRRGHLEALASGPAIGRATRRRLYAGAKSKIYDLVNGKIEDVTAEHVGQAAQLGDEFAIAQLAEAGAYIGCAIADFLHFSNPSIVIIGGGVALNVGEFLLGPLRRATQERLMDEHYACDIVPAQLGDDVGLLGTLALAAEMYPA